MSIADNAGEALADNAEVVVDKSGRSIDGLIRWFEANQADLPTGLAAAAVIVVVMLVLRWIGSKIAASDPDCSRWSGIIGRMLAKTGVLFMVATALDIVTTYTNVPARIGRLADIFFIITFAFQGAIWARELILGMIGRRAGDDPNESTLGNAMSIIRVLVSIAVFALAIVVILDNLGVNVTALVAGLGIGGIAIGLAAQGIFSDLFAALAILFDRPFRRGDTIRYGTTIGTVEKIGLKTTRLRALTGEDVVMANTQLLEQEIRNLAEGLTRRTTLTLGVTYQTSPEKLARIPEITKNAVNEQSGCAFVRCAMTGFGASSLDHELIYDTTTLDINEIARDRSTIMMEIIKGFAAENIDFAYPTQTTFTAAPDGSFVLPYRPKPLES